MSTAFVFPGQGAQKVGMLAEAAEVFSSVRETFAEAGEILGYDLWKLAQSGPQEELNLTEITQPLLLTSSVALWRAWQEEGGAKPDFVAGHSLGEYSALVCSGVLQFENAVALVRNRGKYMQEAVPVGAGAMSAVLGLDDEQVREYCASLSSESAVVEAVNFNSPGQVVIAGHKDAVNTAGIGLKELGARRVAPLPVSAPFHTSLMAPAGERLAQDMADLNFNSPDIPVVHNVTGKTEGDPETIRALMIEQTSSPVLWTACVAEILREGASEMIECGPGKVLAGLIKKIDRSASVTSIDMPDALREAASN